MRAFGLPKVVGFYLAMLGIAAVALSVRSGSAHLLPVATAKAWGMALGLGASVGILLVLVSRLLMARTAWGQRLAAELRAAIGELGRLEALIVAVLSAAGEEVLFRGVLQPALGLWITSLVFGLAHTGPGRQFRAWTLMALIAGLIFGAMAESTGNLAAPVLTHFIVNFKNLRSITCEIVAVEVEMGPRGGDEPTEV